MSVQRSGPIQPFWWCVRRKDDFTAERSGGQFFSPTGRRSGFPCQSALTLAFTL